MLTWQPVGPLIALAKLRPVQLLPPPLLLLLQIPEVRGIAQFPAAR